jgi:hypothetical protein
MREIGVVHHDCEARIVKTGKIADLVFNWIISFQLKSSLQSLPEAIAESISSVTGGEMSWNICEVRFNSFLQEPANNILNCIGGIAFAVRWPAFCLGVTPTTIFLFSFQDGI